jgi:hypothetical protein
MVNDDSANPLGYLRRFVSYKKVGGRLVVTTTPSNLDEAADELRRRGFTDVHTSSIRPLTAETAEADTTGSIDQDFAFDPLETSDTLLRWQGGTGDSVTVTARTKLTVAPHVKASFVAGPSTVKEGSLFISGRIDGSIEFDATVTGVVSLEKTGKLLAKPWRKAALVGGVPVTLSVDLGWKCGLEVNGEVNLTVGAAASGSIGATGAEWHGDEVNTTIGTPSYSFDPVGPTITAGVESNLNCHVIPTVTVSLFDILGPIATVDLWAKIDAKHVEDLDYDVGLYAGGSVSLGGGLQPFGYELTKWVAPPLTFGPEEALVSKTLSLGGAASEPQAPTDGAGDGAGGFNP